MPASVFAPLRVFTASSLAALSLFAAHEATTTRSTASQAVCMSQYMLQEAGAEHGRVTG